MLLVYTWYQVLQLQYNIDRYLYKVDTYMYINTSSTRGMYRYQYSIPVSEYRHIGLSMTFISDKLHVQSSPTTAFRILYALEKDNAVLLIKKLQQ